MPYDRELLLEKYLDALDRLDPDDFDSAEAFYASQAIWSEVVEDHALRRPLYS